MRDKCSFSLKPARSTPNIFQVLAENSLIKNILEEGNINILIVEHDSFRWNSSLLGVFWPRRGLQANHGTA